METFLGDHWLRFGKFTKFESKHEGQNMHHQRYTPKFYEEAGRAVAGQRHFEVVGFYPWRRTSHKSINYVRWMLENEICTF